MQRRYPLLILMTALVTGVGIYLGLSAFRSIGLPFNVTTVDAHTAVIAPIAGIPLPPGLRAGDRIDLTALDQAARIAVIATPAFTGTRPLGRTYSIVIQHEGTSFTVPVTTVNYSNGTKAVWFEWSLLCLTLLFSGIGLLLLWRGRDRAAVGMAMWAIAYQVGITCAIIPADGIAGLCLGSIAAVFYLLARVGFYVMIEAVVGPSLGSRTRAVFRGSFVLLLLAGSVFSPGGALLYVATGWGELLRPEYGLIFTASYLVPIAMLAVGYSAADLAQRLRLRWMLWGSGVWLGGILLSNTPVLGFPTSIIVSSIAQVAAVLGFLYAVLRHRVVNVSVVINRTLVYGATSMLVLGVLAAVNSIAQHAALGTSASLLLQVIVPLSLGIVLNRVRTYMDRTVEQVFFRSKYLAEMALRRFARDCGHIGQIANLLAQAVAEIHRQTGSHGVALYAPTAQGYERVQQRGAVEYPASMDSDDPALVTARAERHAVDLSTFVSAFGTDGCVFPMMVLGVERGVLVLANRPGESYAADERALLEAVVCDVGAAWRILRARENEEFVRAVARGQFDLEAAKTRAHALELAWAGV